MVQVARCIVVEGNLSPFCICYKQEQPYPWSNSRICKHRTICQADALSSLIYNRL